MHLSLSRLPSLWQAPPPSPPLCSSAGSSGSYGRCAKLVSLFPLCVHTNILCKVMENIWLGFTLPSLWSQRQACFSAHRFSSLIWKCWPKGSADVISFIFLISISICNGVELVKNSGVCVCIVARSWLLHSVIFRSVSCAFLMSLGCVSHQ